MLRRPVHELDESPPPPGWLAWLETSGIALALLALGWLMHRDPLFLTRPFPWPLLAPLITGLRYGFAHGFAAAFALCLGLAAAWRLHLYDTTAFPASYALGLLLTGMIAGEFCDMWARRLRRLHLVNDYRRIRLDEFTRAYHVLKVSHDRLEQRVAGGTLSLREALATLQRQLTAAEMHRDQPLYGLSSRILDLFASYAWLQAAALYPVGDERIADAPCATLGTATPLLPDDPLVDEALAHRKLVSVRPGEGALVGHSNLLACLPIVDVQDRVWAVLAVREMLFVAFHEDNLRLLAVLGGHIGDLLTRREEGGAEGGVSPAAFLRHVERAVSDRRRHGVPAMLLGMILENPETAGALAQRMTSQRRGLDQIQVLTNRRGRTTLLLLMPITGDKGVNGYLARLEQQEKSGTLADAGLVVHRRALGRRDEAAPLVAEIKRQCEVESQ
jgi:hypothetical protein